jgi:hypothetical protein
MVSVIVTNATIAVPLARSIGNRDWGMAMRRIKRRGEEDLIAELEKSRPPKLFI